MPDLIPPPGWPPPGWPDFDPETDDIGEYLATHGVPPRTGGLTAGPQPEPDADADGPQED